MTDKIKNPGAAATASEASKTNTLPKHVNRDNNPDINFKQCKTCHERKPVSEFRKNNKTSDGYINTCFACCRKKKASKSSYKEAVYRKCKECIYDPIAGVGSWKKQVENCPCSTCPLFDKRPTSGGKS